MATKTLMDLRKIRTDHKAKLVLENAKEIKDIKIIVGKGTCGIAAGAEKIFNTIIEEIEDKELKNVTVRSAGCMCLCYVLLPARQPGKTLSALPDVTNRCCGAEQLRKR